MTQKPEKEGKRRLLKTLFAVELLIIAGLIAYMTQCAIKDINNLLKNPGFEDGTNSWYWLDWSKAWAPFKLSTELSRSGNSAIHLPVRSRGRQTAPIVWGAVQEVVVTQEPVNCIEGYYYIDRWQRGTSKQYAQVVIIDMSRPLEKGSAQIRYLLSGVDKPMAKDLINIRFIMLNLTGSAKPITNEWIKFSSDPAADFLKHWGYVPTQGHKLRVLFEARFDSFESDRPETIADVLYDDLYLGPQNFFRCAN